MQAAAVTAAPAGRDDSAQRPAESMKRDPVQVQ